jgi:hypothetical protein
MSQITFAEAEYSIKKKTRREIFLGKMETLIPWKKLEKILAKHYPKGQLGRPPYPLSTMLRVHAMQLFCNLSDPAPVTTGSMEQHLQQYRRRLSEDGCAPGHQVQNDGIAV